MLEILLDELLRECLFFLGAVSRGGAFPQPLSRAEEEKQLALLAAGSDHARKTLIEHNMRLVVHIAKKYQITGYTQEDLISIGAVGLIKAVGTYRADTGSTLATYAARCIENELLMCLRAGKKSRGDVSLQETIGTDGEGNDISFLDILGTPKDGVEEEVAKRITLSQVKSTMKHLPEREKIVLSLRYGLYDGRAYPQHEIADRLGISRSYVSRVEKHGVELLRRAIVDGEALNK